MLFKKRPWAMLLVFLVLFSSLWFGPRPVRATQNNPLPAKAAVNPSSIASLALQPSSAVTFELNITDSSPFAGFVVGIFYNSSVLRNPQVDFMGNVLGNDAILDSECIDGFGSLCTPDVTFDGQGVVSLALFTNSGLNTTTPNGKLFSVTFTVASKGFSAIHFVHQFVGTSPNGTPLQVITYDGYFTNMDCPSGSGNLCKPPIVSFTPPVEPGVNQPEPFKATAISQNPGGRITQYNWTWGSGEAKQVYDSPPPGTATPSPNATLRFQFSGMNQVTLSAQDNYGARAFYSMSIFVVRSSVDVFGFFTDPNLNPLPLDKLGKPRVDVVLANGMVRSTDPPQILAWISVTNTGAIQLQSLKLNETLPFDWTIKPQWVPGKGAIHVYYANTTSLATNLEITDPSTIIVSTENPQTLVLAIPNLNATGIGYPLLPGQSILLSVKLSYGLVKTSQSPTSFPLPYLDYIDTASAVGWSQPSYTGTEAPEPGFLLFIMSLHVYVNVASDMPVSFGSLTVRAMVSQKYCVT